MHLSPKPGRTTLFSMGICSTSLRKNPGGKLRVIPRIIHRKIHREKLRIIHREKLRVFPRKKLRVILRIIHRKILRVIPRKKLRIIHRKKLRVILRMSFRERLLETPGKTLGKAPETSPGITHGKVPDLTPLIMLPLPTAGRSPAPQVPAPELTRLLTVCLQSPPNGNPPSLALCLPPLPQTLPAFLAGIRQLQRQSISYIQALPETPRLLIITQPKSFGLLPPGTSTVPARLSRLPARVPAIPTALSRL